MINRSEDVKRISVVLLIFLTGCGAVNKFMLDTASPIITNSKEDTFRVESGYFSVNDNERARRVAFISAANACLNKGYKFFVVTNEQRIVVGNGYSVWEACVVLDVKCYELFNTLPDDFVMTNAQDFKLKYERQLFFPKEDYLQPIFRLDLLGGPNSIKGDKGLIINRFPSNIYLLSVDGHDINSYYFRIRLLTGNHSFKVTYNDGDRSSQRQSEFIINVKKDVTYEISGLASKDKKSWELIINETDVEKKP